MAGTLSRPSSPSTLSEPYTTPQIRTFCPPDNSSVLALFTNLAATPSLPTYRETIMTR